MPLGIAALALLLWPWTALEAADLQDQRGEARQALSGALRDYEVAKESGALMEACINAGFLATLYRALGDQVSEQRWTRTETADCALAGYPSTRASEPEAPPGGKSK